MSKQLILALSKGRILDETLPLLADAGITPAEDLGASRKLLFDTNLPDVKLVILRATDVPTYVQLGAADLGVAGKDVLLEHGAEGLYEPLDLEIARCRLMTAGIDGAEPARARRRVAVRQCRTPLLCRAGPPGRGDQALRGHGAGAADEPGRRDRRYRRHRQHPACQRHGAA